MAHASADDDDVATFELPPGTNHGNWGNKHAHGSRWVRRGKIVAWGPAKAEWDVSQIPFIPLPPVVDTQHPRGLPSWKSVLERACENSCHPSKKTRAGAAVGRHPHQHRPYLTFAVLPLP